MTLAEGDKICTFHRCYLQDFTDKLSVRAVNALYNAGIKTPSEISELSAYQLRAKKHFGEVTVSEISRAMKACGLSLKPDPPKAMQTHELRSRVQFLEAKLRDHGIDIP